jgi:hypothetical protein
MVTNLDIPNNLSALFDQHAFTDFGEFVEITADHSILGRGESRVTKPRSLRGHQLAGTGACLIAG